MAFGIGSFLKGVGDDLGDALIPKEIAPYLGTIGALIAPVAPIAGLTMGQLLSIPMVIIGFVLCFTSWRNKTA